MALVTERLGGTEKAPLSLEVASQLLSASALLLYLEWRLPGMKVIAKKSWALTDDFQAYFTFRDRLFVMETPFANVWVSLIGPPPDEALFGEVESLIQSYSWAHSFLGPLGFARYCFLPFDPPPSLLARHEAVGGAQRVAVARNGTT